MLNSSWYDYSDVYTLVSRTIAITKLASSRGNNNMQVVFKNCAPFTDSISEIHNAQVDNANDINLVMSIYDLKNVYDNIIEMTSFKFC